MIAKGASTLSNAELLAILISSGTREESAVDLTKRILMSAKNNLDMLGKMSFHELQKFRGIGEAKAITIMAALELGRRRMQETAKEKITINKSVDVFEYFQPLLADLSHEEFWIMFLNRANCVIEISKHSMGGVSGTIVDYKLIIKRAIELLAQSLIICHNHPSGNNTPSKNDIDVTEKLRSAAKFFEISILDHIIVGNNSYYSFSDNGL